jgi:hypothetical protein
MAEPQAMKVNMLAELRASDAERAEVADLLKKHFMDGRLDQAEFDERLGAALSAKTRGELTALLGDSREWSQTALCGSRRAVEPGGPWRHSRSSASSAVSRSRRRARSAAPDAQPSHTPGPTIQWS